MASIPVILAKIAKINKHIWTSTTKTTTYTALTSDDIILCSTAGGAWSLGLYASSGNTGKFLYIKKTTSDANALTIDGNGSETINGALTKLLYNQNDAILIACNGSNWDIIAEFKDNYAGISFVIGDAINDITTGIKGDLEVPYKCQIKSATLLANESGSIVIDIWNDTYANYPPTIADTITASAKPTISSATKAQDTTLVGWTTILAKGSILRFNVDSITTIKRVTINLNILRL